MTSLETAPAPHRTHADDGATLRRGLDRVLEWLDERLVPCADGARVRADLAHSRQHVAAAPVDMLVALAGASVDAAADLLTTSGLDTPDHAAAALASAAGHALSGLAAAAPRLDGPDGLHAIVADGLDALADHTNVQAARVSQVVTRLTALADTWREQRAALTPARDVVRDISAAVALPASVTVDPLTGLPNRDAFLRTLAGLGLSGPRPAVVAEVTLANLADLNDEHGHVTGDRALSAVAQALVSHVRPQDLCARVRGATFAVLLPGLSLRYAEARVASATSMVQANRMLADDGRVVAIRLTITVTDRQGFSSLHPA